MKRIGVLSDTHGIVPKQVYTFFKDCDELWHAGDCGPGVLEELKKFKPIKAVWGNIDNYELHYEYPKINIFECEGQKVVMTHIGGYPKHYETKGNLQLFNFSTVKDGIIHISPTVLKVSNVLSTETVL